MNSRNLILILTGITLSACATGSYISRKNPDFFNAKLKDRQLQGTYNPAGYSSAQVRKLVGTLCQQGHLTGYSETRQEGLVSWTTGCSSGFSERARTNEFERIDGTDQVMVETMGSDGRGNLLYNRFEVSL
ncbi:hypothetical protein [Flexibacterium corallicola]|uniref:hypothetical protein n=1 Tax=Flexibacterium corallicola TaxID=3037259 RepID=UPI00286F8D29|nr:hypothetical protein [Pseudovibrio sp. M1P-2-3]